MADVPDVLSPTCKRTCLFRWIRPALSLRTIRSLMLMIVALMAFILVCYMWNQTIALGLHSLSSRMAPFQLRMTGASCRYKSAKKEPKSWCLLNNTHLEKMLKLEGPSKTEVKNASSCKAWTQPLASVADVNIEDVNFYSLEEIKTIAENVTKVDLSPFYPILTKERKVELLTLYLVMARALNKANIPFMITAGSLLGYYRTSGILPWDDDLDVVINVSRWRDVMKALNCIEGYELGLHYHQRWAIYPVPIVLEGIAMPGPQDLLAYLRLAYTNLTQCSSQTYVHAKIIPNYSVLTVPCTDLFPLYGEFRLPP